MTFIKDLGPCRYLPLECEALVAVGWVDADADYPRGVVPEQSFLKLKDLCRSPWQPVVAAGGHACNLCQFDAPTFSANVFVPHGGKIYVAPVAVVHYIAAHRYLPPPVFIEAVLACPSIQSIDYKRAILENGGRSLVRSRSHRLVK